MVISFSQRYETVADLVGNAGSSGPLAVVGLCSVSQVCLYRSSIVSLDDIMLVLPVSQKFLRMCKSIEPLHHSLVVRGALKEIKGHSGHHLDSGLAKRSNCEMFIAVLFWSGRDTCM